MLTMQPLPPVDTLNAHDGFVFLCFMCLCVFLFVGTMLEKQGKIILFSVLVCFLNFAAFQSWTTGTITYPKNEKVIGVLQGFTAEGERYQERSGKQTITRENHLLYVVYAVEGQGVVTFSANKGTIYPERATLYKN